jgi:SAM-dependent methyltransferase
MKEEDIRPENIFNEYLLLAEKDVEDYFKNAPFHFIACPACGSTKTCFEFRKMGFDYETCKACNTLFVNPRPEAKAFSGYYKDSPSVRFWATTFYRETEEKRRKHIIAPKAAMVNSILSTYIPDMAANSYIIDIGAGYGVFCEELQKIVNENVELVAVEPSTALQEVCTRKNIKVIPKFLDDITEDDLPCSKVNVIAATSFELMEHLHDPAGFISSCHNILAKNGLLILTTLSWEGFDLQVLREKSKSIHPPHHINFFTPESLSLLLEKNGFEVLEVTTPGKLDVDIVRKQIEDIADPFIRRLLSLEEENISKFQIFLQDSKLSSHMLIVAKAT